MNIICYSNLHLNRVVWACYIVQIFWEVGVECTCIMWGVGRAVNQTSLLSKLFAVKWYTVYTIEYVHGLGVPCFVVVNTLRPIQNGRHFPNIFKCIFLNENVWILIIISMKLVPKVRITNIPALVQIMAWRRLGDKPLSESIVVSLLMQICVTRPQWVISSAYWRFMWFIYPCYYRVASLTKVHSCKSISEGFW